MALKRILIQPYEKDKGGSIGSIQVSAINPNQYTLAKRVQWKEVWARAMDMPQLQFESGGARTLSLSLLFDTYEEPEGQQDVRAKTKDVAQLAEVMEGKGRPPVIVVTWGQDAPASMPAAGVPFQGVIENISQKFTMFLPDGTPVRATVDLALKEVKAPERQLKETPRKRSSPIQARTRQVRGGDSLWSIAAAEYGDPSRWRPIAEANGIENPRELEPGTVLLIPSID